MPLSPVTNPGAFLGIRVGGRAFPGRIVAIRGLEDAIEWTTTRGITGSGWTQVCRGRVPIENIEIDCSFDARTRDEKDAAWKDHYRFVVFARGKKPPLPTKPPALEVYGAHFRAAGVISVVWKGMVEPIFNVGKNVATYRFKENAKSVAFPAEIPEPAILDETNPSPKSFQETALVAAANTSFGTGSGGPSAATLSERYPGIGAVGQ